VKIENPSEWPSNQWPRFLELLRAFCLSDEEQDALFPDLREPRYHASNEGDGYTLCSYSPAFSEIYDLCAVYILRGEFSDEDEEMSSRISTLFRRAWNEVLESVECREFPCAPRANRIELERMRPQLRVLCLEALAFWNEEIRPPASSWQELAM
jgi:hypothetical protein